VSSSRVTVGRVSELPVYAVALLCVALAPAFGWMALYGSPMVAGVMIGAVVGIILLFLPVVSVWMILVLGFFSGAILSMIGPAAGKLTWIISLLSLALMIPSILRLVWRNEAPSFIWAAFAFLVYSIIVSLAQWADVAEFVGGVKRYFQGYGLMLALALIPFTSLQLDRWKRLLLVVGLAQLPFAVFQLLVLVPMRGGIGIGQATDVVAGTFGGSLEGGSNNSDMVMFLLIALAAVMARWRYQLISTRSFAVLTALLMIPMGLGETKIVVILLPVTLMIVYKDKVMNSPMGFLLAILVGALMAICMLYLYAEFYMSMSVPDMVDNTIQYNFGDMGYGGYVLNRFTALEFWFNYQDGSDLFGAIFGNGLSSSYTSSVQDLGHMAEKFPRHGLNLTTASTLLWDLGVIGVVLFASIFLLAWRKANKLLRCSSSDVVKADVTAVQVALVLVLAFFNYNDTLVNLVTTEIIVASVLGYLSILVRQHEEKNTLHNM
jgi:hypothetical protein